MNVLLIGANGQLGHELIRTYPQRMGVVLNALDFPDIDITDRTSLDQSIKKNVPDLIINAAAYTNVDGAEQDRDNAYDVNSNGAKNLAQICQERRLRLVHISTDFVFSGAHNRPYKPHDKTMPLSVYGKSKLEGENAVLEILDKDALIIRTAWLYSSHGNNFVKTMLRLMAEKESLSIVDDQIGTPTWAHGLAKILWKAVQNNLAGIYHWTDFGIASWYDFAVAIQEEAHAAGILLKKIPLIPISTDQYPTPAQRPFFSVLDKTAICESLDVEPVHWRVQLGRMIKEL